ANKYPGSQFFFDGNNREQYNIWREAEKMDLLGCLSLVPDNLESHQILLQADMLIHPQPLGKVQNLTIAAMANGLPIIAHKDQWLDYLIDGQTAMVLDSPTSKDWTKAIANLCDNPQAAAQLGHNARQWIADN